MKTKYLILIILVLALTACRPLVSEVRTCEVDADCLPEPLCHPQNCMNKNGWIEPPEDRVCTQIFDPTAAYSAEDCVCEKNECANRNRDRIIEEY